MATAELTLITAPDGRELICVGERRYIVMCLNPANGQVVDMLVDLEVSDMPAGLARLVSRTGLDDPARLGRCRASGPLSWRFSRPP